MSLVFGIVMCAILVPTLLIMSFILYPKNWKTSKLILGVSMRKEYTEGDTADTVDKLYNTRRNQAKKLLLLSIIASAILLLLHGFILQTTLWMILIFASLLGLYIPYSIGNREMKSLKRALGITAEKISYTDMSAAGSIRTVKLSSILIPNILGFIGVLFALFIDLKIIPIRSELAGNFMGTGVCATFFVMGIVISVIADLMDSLKNEVISSDSTINTNYNRAKKKNLSNSIIAFLWLNAILMGLSYAFSILMVSEIFFIIGIVLYIVILMAGLFIYASRNRKIEIRYKKKMTIVEDEDDHWIGGLFYYNPNNKRLNISKRAGVGTTFNFAHPVGKLAGVLISITLLATVVILVYMGMTEATPLKLKIEDNKLICHQLTDDYVIDIDDISDIEWGEDVSSLRFFKVAGFGISNLYKGSFNVNGENDCKVFLNPEEGSYIKVVTDEYIYYISASTSDETRAIYETIIKTR